MPAKRIILRTRIDPHAPGTRLPSPASEFARSRGCDRFLRPAVREHVEDELGRLSRARVAERRAHPVQQGGRAAADHAAIGDLAFRLARDRRAQVARNLQDAPGGEAAPALHDRRRRLRTDQQRHLAADRRRARTDQGRDRRGQGQGHQAQGRRRLRLHGGTRRRDRGISRRFAGRAHEPRAPVAGAAVLRAALVPKAPQRGAGDGAWACDAADRAELRGRARTRPHLARADARRHVPHAVAPPFSSAT